MLERSASLRLMTYNVHRCVGPDGVLNPRRVAAVIARYRPDVVALQELDVRRRRTEYADQPAQLAELLKMSFHFHPSFTIQDEQYGNAILSRLPMRLVKAGTLPSRPVPFCREDRGVLWVEIDWQGRPLQIVNTHLGLWTYERLAQIEALLGPDWLGDPRCTTPHILCGDFNTWPGTRAYNRLRQALHDAQERNGQAAPSSTFPSYLPLLRLDHVFVSADLAVTDAQVPRTQLTRTASDHLPLIVDVAPKPLTTEGHREGTEITQSEEKE